MNKIIFNEHQQRVWEANSNVSSVSNRTIQYTPELKVKAVNENLKGGRPYHIIAEHGFDLIVHWRGQTENCPKTLIIVTHLQGSGPLKKSRDAYQVPGNGNGTLKKARGARKTGEETQLIPAEKYVAINTVVRKFQLKNW